MIIVVHNRTKEPVFPAFQQIMACESIFVLMTERLFYKGQILILILFSSPGHLQITMLKKLLKEVKALINHFLHGLLDPFEKHKKDNSGYFFVKV